MHTSKKTANANISGLAAYVYDTNDKDAKGKRVNWRVLNPTSGSPNRPTGFQYLGRWSIDAYNPDDFTGVRLKLFIDYSCHFLWNVKQKVLDMPLPNQDSVRVDQ